VRAAALEALGMLGSVEGAALMRRLLADDNDPRVRHASALALGFGSLDRDTVHAHQLDADVVARHERRPERRHGIGAQARLEARLPADEDLAGHVILRPGSAGEQRQAHDGGEQDPASGG